MRNAYIINTNLTHNPNCEQQMLQQKNVQHTIRLGSTTLALFAQMT